MTEQTNFFNDYKIKLIHKMIEDFYEFGDSNNASTILDAIFSVTEFDPFTKKNNDKDMLGSEAKND